MKKANPFATAPMAAGYASSRPPLHARIIERVQAHLGRPEKVRRALDVGCGAGLSTAPLALLASQCIGMEPVESMLAWTSQTAPGADFAVGAAEALPFGAGTLDLIAAAGSLNYANLDAFFPEALRVLTPDGLLLVYDFSAGREFRDDDGLAVWFAEFRRRYPPPKFESRPLSPEILAQLDCGFRVAGHEHFTIGLMLDPAFYLNYMMTETNVAAAIRSGVPEDEIRIWCRETLAPVFDGQPREVLFRGYFCYSRRS